VVALAGDFLLGFGGWTGAAGGGAAVGGAGSGSASSVCARGCGAGAWGAGACGATSARVCGMAAQSAARHVNLPWSGALHALHLGSMRWYRLQVRCYGE
jgi:hypothetical protein